MFASQLKSSEAGDGVAVDWLHISSEALLEPSEVSTILNGGLMGWPTPNA